MFLNIEKISTDKKKFIEDVKFAFDSVLEYNKDKSLMDKKFNVILGSTVYTFKIFSEIIESSYNNSILGRIGIRVIIEIYIILKYLIKKEEEDSDLWEKYQNYGLDKYKLILLKSREYNNLSEDSHIVEPFIDLLVNEELSEDFRDVDFKYFDKKNIRLKSEDVGEKELYGVYYEYGSNYAHGLWGAVRESSMVKCFNSAHKHYAVPDTKFAQNSPPVYHDAIMMFDKILDLLNSLYPLPSWFIEEYGV